MEDRRKCAAVDEPIKIVTCHRMVSGKTIGYSLLAPYSAYTGCSRWFRERWAARVRYGECVRAPRQTSHTRRLPLARTAPAVSPWQGVHVAVGQAGCSGRQTAPRAATRSRGTTRQCRDSARTSAGMQSRSRWTRLPVQGGRALSGCDGGAAADAVWLRAPRGRRAAARTPLGHALRGPTPCRTARDMSSRCGAGSPLRTLS
jgi:hypothetical protein